VRRYWIEPEQLHSAPSGELTVSFDSEQFHHIFDVCRQEKGSHFEVIHPNRKAYLIEVTEVLKKKAFAKVIETREIAPLSSPEIHIALSLPRYPVLESVIEKMVEMGVASVHPFFSDFSFVRTSQNFPSEKIARWKKIITSATQQSGRGELMDLPAPQSWDQMLEKINQTPESLCLFAYEGPSTLGVKDFLQTQIKAQGRPKKVWLVVGSEGGFSSDEVKQMESLAFHPVTLGSQVLRVETACMTLVSVLKYQFDLMR